MLGFVHIIDSKISIFSMQILSFFHTYIIYPINFLMSYRTFYLHSSFSSELILNELIEGELSINIEMRLQSLKVLEDDNRHELFFSYNSSNYTIIL
jgi:nitroimidazol reductase NimA-like FMN-containing flavoprotein (pyridoxamine 5'-phosphate oxidase superfamily)